MKTAILILLISYTASVSGQYVWQNYTFNNIIPPEYSIDANRIIDIQEDTDGIFWIAGGFGVIKGKPDNWQYITLSENYMDKFAFAPNGDVYVAGGKGWATTYIFRYNDDTWTQLFTEQLRCFGPGSIFADMFFDKQGTLWCFLDYSIYTMKNDTLYEVEGNYIANSLLNAYLTQDETIWTGSFQLNRYDGVQWDTFSLEGETRCLDLCDDTNGNLWMACNNGLWVFNGSEFVDYTSKAPDLDKVTTVFRDSYNNIWIGTELGIIRFDGTNWVVFTVADGLISNEIRCIYEDNNNNLWIGTDGGISIVSLPLGITEKTTEDIHIYPNPASSSIHFQLSAIHHFPIEVQIFNIEGRSIYTEYVIEQTDNHIVDISDLKTGIYIIQLQSEHYIYRKKVVIHNR